MERKKIGLGGESFEDLITGNKYYVDKTDFIKTVFGDSGAEVLLITRPRRFGKTLTLSTFESFLSINRDNPGDVSKQLKLFEGTHILSDEGTSYEVAARKKFVQEHMGRHPVISISLKKVEGLDFTIAYQRFARVIRMYADTVRYLRDSPRLDELQKDELEDLLNIKFLRETANKDTLGASLATLMRLMHLHFGIRPIVLIDEYDVPLAKAEACGYYTEMLDLLRDFLGALKTNGDFSCAVLTGCLRVSKESIFTGLNHFVVNSIFDDAKTAFCSAIGFTKQETEMLLDYCGLDEYKTQVKEHYDGYRFGGVSMFCPWDVLSFSDDAKDKVARGEEPRFDNYWTHTSGNQIIDAFADYIKPEHIDDMQTLVDGGAIEVNVREDLNYPDLKQHVIDDFWTMLLYSGYLTVAAESSLNLKEPQQVRIPNLEIRECFEDRILKHFKYNPQVMNGSAALARAMFAGNSEEVALMLRDKLRGFISVRDVSSKSSPHEDLYQGFMNGIFSAVDESVIKNFRANRESGDGYPDISFTSMDDRMGVIIELKRTNDPKQMHPLSLQAITQIEEKHYSEDMEIDAIPEILAYGICFCGKRCSVSVKKLK